MTDRLTSPDSATLSDRPGIKSLDLIDYIADMAKELETMCKAQDLEKLAIIFDLAFRETGDIRGNFRYDTESYAQVHEVRTDFATS